MANQKALQSWFKKANEDLFSARLLLDSRHPKAFGAIAFHCQQCVEKILKGFLVSRDKKFEKIHDLKTIAGLVLVLEPSLESFLKEAIELNPYAVAFRYSSGVKGLRL